jgi:muramoyltetrapeptide carboxypeptidase
MTLLIDPPNAAGHGRIWSHLASDTSYDELHAFAATLGVPSRGFDRDHYDIPAERYDAVVAAGAVPVSSRELVGRLTAAGLRRRKGPALGPRPPGAVLAKAHRLRPGDVVAVVSPAGPAPSDRLDAGIAVLEGWGLRVRHNPAPAHPTLDYLAAADEARAAQLMTAWCDREVRAVFCARGGYGVHRMVDLLDFSALAAAGPKLLVGFSDITALHMAFGLRLGLATIHGPVLTSLANDPAPLHAALFDPAPHSLPVGRVVVPGTASGVLVGGNLSLLAAGVGTPDAGLAAGGIAVIEDVAEPLHRIDRMITQLMRAGWFDGARGVVLGDFDGSESPAKMIADRVADLGVPVVADAPVGHGSTNLPFGYGVRATLDTATLSLSPHEGMVR